MAAKKFLRNNAGTVTEVYGVQTSTGVGNAGDIVSLTDQGVIDQSMMPPGITPDTASIVASEALAAGDFVNVWSNGGAFNVRKADASVTGKKADGYVLAAVASGASASVFFDDNNSQVTGQSAGDVWLSTTTPGKTQTTAPTTAGQDSQTVGDATSATNIHVRFSLPIVLA